MAMMRTKTEFVEAKAECYFVRPIDNLVLEGGAVRGIFHFGVFSALDQLGLLQRIKRIAGSSIGSLVGFGAALGYSSEELTNKMLKIHLPNFKDFILPVPDHYYAFHENDNSLTLNLKIIYNLIKYSFLFSKNIINIFLAYGIFHGKFIEEMVLNIIRDKFPGKKTLTFRELHDLKTQFPEMHFKDLYVTAVNVTDLKLEIFSYETTPDMPIHIAIHCSMALPFIYKPVEYQGKYYIDGGLIKNLPIRIFDHEKYLEKGCLTSKGINMRTLGVCLSTENRTRTIRDKLDFYPPNFSFLNFLLLVISSPLFFQDEMHRHSHDPLRTIFLNTSELNPLNFHVKKTKIVEFIEQAKKQTMEFAENYLINVPDPNADSFENKKKQFKSILSFCSLFMKPELKKDFVKKIIENYQREKNQFR